MSAFRFTQGPKILVDFGNMILDELEAVTIRPGASVRLTRSPGGTLLDVVASSVASQSAWPWKVYNTTTGSTGQVQLNGSDGFVAQLNSFVCDVNGDPSDTLLPGPPPAYPQLAVTGNGYIYAFAVPNTAGTASPLDSLDLGYYGTVQSQDGSNPAGYYFLLVATISNYTVDGSGNISFSVNNVYGSGYGPATLYYCNGVIGVY